MEVDLAYDVFGLVWFGLIIQNFNDSYGYHSMLGMVARLWVSLCFVLFGFCVYSARDLGISACGSAEGSEIQG